MVAGKVTRAAVIAGARPNFVKIAPLLRAMRADGIEALFIHTGQHYDRAMSDELLADLGLAEPDINLGVGSGSHASQTARVMTAFDSWLDEHAVDQVVTVGDVNSTLACTLVAAKRSTPVAHVEAGLRSFDRTMPEEINRLVVDALATWLFTPSADASANLLAEGADSSRIHMVGNIMVDSLLASLDLARSSPIREELGLEGRSYEAYQPPLYYAVNAVLGGVPDRIGATGINNFETYLFLRRHLAMRPGLALGNPSRFATAEAQVFTYYGAERQTQNVVLEPKCHTEISLSATLDGEPLGRVEVKALFKLATYVLARRALSGELVLFDHLFTYFK